MAPNSSIQQVAYSVKVMKWISNGKRLFLFALGIKDLWSVDFLSDGLPHNAWFKRAWWILPFLCFRPLGPDKASLFNSSHCASFYSIPMIGIASLIIRFLSGPLEFTCASKYYIKQRFLSCSLSVEELSF